MGEGEGEYGISSSIVGVFEAWKRNTCSFCACSVHLIQLHLYSLLCCVYVYIVYMYMYVYLHSTVVTCIYIQAMYIIYCRLHTCTYMYMYIHMIVYVHSCYIQCTCTSMHVLRTCLSVMFAWTFSFEAEVALSKTVLTLGLSSRDRGSDVVGVATCWGRELACPEMSRPLE